MRIRSIKPEFFKHDDLASLPPLCRILFVGLWCMADCAGRLEDRVKRIKAEVLPYDNCDVDAMLGQLQSAGFIERYNVDAMHLIQIPSFEKNQRISGKEAAQVSDYPGPPGKQSGSTREAPGIPVLEGKGREGIEKNSRCFPESLRDENFKTAWAEWEDHCRSRGKPHSPQSRRAQLSECERAGPGVSAAALQRSIAGNATWILWQTNGKPVPTPAAPRTPKFETDEMRDLRERKERGE